MKLTLNKTILITLVAVGLSACNTTTDYPSLDDHGTRPASASVAPGGGGGGGIGGPSDEVAPPAEPPQPPEPPKGVLF